jgi:hypothetical protein
MAPGYLSRSNMIAFSRPPSLQDVLDEKPDRRL